MVKHGSFVPGYLSVSEDRVYRHLGQKLTLLHAYQEVRDKVLHNKGAIIEGTSYMEYQVARWPTEDIYYVEEKLYASYAAWAFQKSTPWVYSFNRYVAWFFSGDVVHQDAVQLYN